MKINREYLLLSDEHGFTWGVIQGKIGQGLILLHMGAYPEAVKFGKEALHGAQNEYFTCEALILLTQAYIALGEPQVAWEYLDKCTTTCPTRLVGTSLFVAGNDLYQSLLAAIHDESCAAWEHLLNEIQNAIVRKSELTLANAVAVAAYLKAVDDDVVAALELYSLAQKNPFIANSKWFKDVIWQEIEAKSQDLDSEVRKTAWLKGESLDLWMTVGQLLENKR